MTRGFIIGALKRIEDAPRGQGRAGNGASEATIQKAEAALGLRFPPSYRAFLKAFGYGGAGDVYLLGVSDDFDLSEPAFPNVVGINLEERKSGLPNHVLLVEERDDGGFHALDFSTCDHAGETSVVVWPKRGASPLDKLETIAGEFGEFLLLRTDGLHGSSTSKQDSKPVP